MTDIDGFRIGYVTKVYPRFSETFIVNEILAHEAAGLAIDIFSLKPPRDPHFQDVIARVRAGVTYLPENAPKAEVFWTALREARGMPGFRDGMQAGETATADEMYAAILLAREIPPRGIVHLHAHFGTSAATVARIAAALSATSFSFTAHAKDIFHESVSPEEFVATLRDAAAVVSVSDYNVTYLRELYGQCAARVRRVYNGLELERFPYRPPSDRPARIVAVGRLVEKKGFEILIDACALLRSRDVTVECDILGTGELERALRARIEGHGLQRSVVLRGARPQAEVISAVSNASVLAVPCVVGADGNRDGLPTVLLEAMALGTPCVATDVTGIPELIADGRTGLLVDQHDAAGLAAAIERLLVDVPLRLRLAAAARQRIEADFDSRRTAAALRDIFAECVGVRARVAAGL